MAKSKRIEGQWSTKHYTKKKLKIAQHEPYWSRRRWPLATIGFLSILFVESRVVESFVIASDWVIIFNTNSAIFQ
jgi:hypothetical protein